MYTLNIVDKSLLTSSGEELPATPYVVPMLVEPLGSMPANADEHMDSHDAEAVTISLGSSCVAAPLENFKGLLQENEPFHSSFPQGGRDGM